MALTISNLSFKLSANTASLRQDFAKANSVIKSSGTSASQARPGFDGLSASFASLRNQILAVVSATAALKAIGSSVKLAADLESTTVAFTTLLGSADLAKNVLADIAEFAANTPFQLPELTTAGQKLFAFGTTADEIMPTLQAIGDVSAGVGAPFGEIAEIFGKNRVQGRLFMADINQLTNRGIPIIGELAKQFGITEAEVRKMVEKGRVHFHHMEAAFFNLAGKGGKFHGMMEAQSKTLNGVISTVKDNIGALATEFGELLLPTVKTITESMLEFIKVLREMDLSSNSFVQGMKKIANAISSVDFATVKTIAKVVAFAASFSAALSIIPRVIAGIKAVVIAVRSFTTAMVLAKSVTLVGALTTAAALAVGATAAMAVGGQFDEMNEAITKASASAKDASKNTGKTFEEMQAQANASANAMTEASAEAKDWAKIGETITNSVATPFETFQSKMEELKGAVVAGAITWETFNRAVLKAKEELDAATESKRNFDAANRGVGAVLKGTTAGFSAVQEARRQQQDQAKQAEIRKRQLDTANRFLGEINAKIQQDNVQIQPVRI